MLAVVLVGGFGTRLRPLTNAVPKPMLPVAHQPMIVRLVEGLAAGGVTEVVLALGFLPEPFEAAFPSGEHDGVRIRYAVEPEPLDTAGAIAFAADAGGVDTTFVVANGDIITDLDVADLVAAHRAGGTDATIHLTPVADPSAFGVVELGDDRIVRRFVEKPEPGETTSNLINAGTYVLEPSVLDLIEREQRVSIERAIFPQLVDDGRLAGFATDDYWIDTGRPALYLQANLDLITGARTTVEVGQAPGATVDANALVIESVIGAGAGVATGASVSMSVLLPGAQVGEGALVERSVIAGRVDARAVVRDSVVGVDGLVPADTELIAGRLPTVD